ncbi:DUF1311 domain-containing protein [Trinickia dinghuensis]|uniref:DUF1311 domain-containing protein n=2 Tax=Trinickia dinghuensis TaxID=2291023 RepID=A0A3D8JQK7_9BURK|nr:DUF1311 domain-containing protein [Trinickia dinghuensis]
MTPIGLGLVMAILLPRLVLAASTIPALTERALREECSTSSQARMLACIAKRAGESQELLRDAETNAARALAGWDEDDRYVNQAKARLGRSNKEFEKYRQVQCDFSSSLVGGAAGNSHEIDRLACLAELNNRRAEQLRDEISALPTR